MTSKSHHLTVEKHDRDFSGMTYVYPVLSRRAGGVSIGINLNPNNACNWRCVYCQVEGLQAGKGPPIDLALLEAELHGLFTAIRERGYLERAAPEGSREVKDIAFSGNGEPTSSPDFEAAMEVVTSLLSQLAPPRPKLVLITNGSLTHRPETQRALSKLGAMNGEVWFKFDSATDAGARSINRGGFPVSQHLEKLKAIATLAPTWLQTCLFSRQGEPPSREEQTEYLRVIHRLTREQVPVRGVYLYSLARPSYQPEAPELGRLSAEWLENFAQRIRGAGLSVKVSP